MLIQTFVILVGIALGGILGYWAQDREPPIQLIAQEVTTPTVNPGGQFRIRLHINRARICQVTIEHIMYDVQRGRYPLPEETWHIAPGGVGVDEYEIVLLVPPSMRAGDAQYRAIRAYYCNPLQRWLNMPIVMVMPDAKFVVSGPRIIPEVNVRPPTAVIPGPHRSDRTPIYPAEADPP